MEDFRYKQAQDLLKKSANNSSESFKLKNPQAGHIDVKKFENIFKDIISAEDFIYSSLPAHDLSKEDASKFIEPLLLARNTIDSILADFKVIEKKEEKIDISKLTDNILFITSKNNFKKSLKKLGVDVQRIVVASVPLNVEDMKEINPKIPEPALKGIKTKVQHIHNDINRKKQSLNPEKIIVLAEDDINGQILAKRAKEHYNAIAYINTNLKDIKDIDIIEILENN
ncbi:hypothetical protein ALNOE001_20630 [Candidatus Methanobinarius endosymbioticus]|uniref:Uncharacterized protein n=1 Tax=Candidatus Methanobinarius endosymbioticus TaxID=2006182 RepID=A0A366M818_9EURY|nr:hypothetical protein ALNOE001_20630 [Candidatus Methanobinarius endosymbioticus]